MNLQLSIYGQAIEYITCTMPRTPVTCCTDRSDASRQFAVVFVDQSVVYVHLEPKGSDFVLNRDNMMSFPVSGGKAGNADHIPTTSTKEILLMSYESDHAFANSGNPGFQMQIAGDTFEKSVTVRKEINK